MYHVPSLSVTATLVAVEILLEHPSSVNRSLIRTLHCLLDNGNYGTVSGLILERLCEYYPHKLTDDLLVALATPGLHRLALVGCNKINHHGMKRLLEKCMQLTHLTLQAENVEADRYRFHHILMDDTLSAPHLVSLDISRCALVTDALVQNVIVNISTLKQLHLVECLNITNEVFLIDDSSQLMRDEHSHHKYICELTTVDISSCSQLTSTAVRHLTTLCGPTLTHLNIAGTGADYTSLLFLSGYSMLAVLPITQCMQGVSLSGMPFMSPTYTPECCSLSSRSFLDVTATHDGSFLCDNNSSDNHIVKSNCDKIPCDKMDTFLRNDENCNTELKEDLLMINDEFDKVGLTSDECEKDNSDLKTNSCVNCNSEEANSTCPDNSIEMGAGSAVYGIEGIQCELNYSDTCANKCSENAESASAQHTCQFCTLVNPVKHVNLKFLIDPAKPPIDHHNHISYKPNLQSLDISYIDLQDKDMTSLSLRHLLFRNCNIQQLQLTWRELDDDILQNIIAENAPGLQSLSLVDCQTLTTLGVSAVTEKCKNLSALNLQGVSFIEDSGVSGMLDNCHVTKLCLSETMITDDTLAQLADKCAYTLCELDLSWCEEITDEGLNTISRHCTLLRQLLLRHCPVVDTTLDLLVNNCTNLRHLNLSGVNILEDQHLVWLSLRLRHLHHLDISWNLDVTDIGMCTLMQYSLTLHTLISIGSKRITSKPFWPIVSDVQSYKRCKALLIMEKKLQEKKRSGGDYLIISSDEDDAGPNLFIPLRSTSYAPSLRNLVLEWCDCVSDAHLAEITAVCRGSLIITDYYGNRVKPAIAVMKQ